MAPNVGPPLFHIQVLQVNQTLQVFQVPELHAGHDFSSNDEIGPVQVKSKIVRPEMGKPNVGPRNHVIPDRFYGTGCWKTFLRKFEICSRYNGWDKNDMETYLSCSLVGDAAQCLWDLTGLGYRELVAKLNERYGTVGHEETYRNELRALQRKQGESLKVLAQTAKKLMSLAYPGESSYLAKELARDFFISALKDPDLELKVREREPRNIDDALRFAQRL